MHGKPRLPKKALTLFLFFLLFLALAPGQPQARELRRSMTFLRPYLMGDAYVAVADEASVLFYNPAAIKSIGETSVELFAPHLNGDKHIKNAILAPEKLSDEFSGVTPETFRTVLDKTIFFNVNLRLPAIVNPEAGLAYGLGTEVLGNLEFMQNPVLPGIRL